MDNPNITMEEYIRLEEEKARRRAIVFNDALTSKAALSCEPTISSLNNDEIDFRISFYESDDEDCTVIFDNNSFSYKIISVNNLKTDSKNDNDKVNMPLLPSPKPTVSYFDDLDYFKDFEKEFPTIVYNDAQTSKLDFLTEPTLSPQHIDKFNLKDETSVSKYDKEEQNVICFNDLFPFNIIYPDELKTDTDNDNDKVDIEHSSGDSTVKPLPDVINTDDGAYAHGSNKLLETNKFIATTPDTKKKRVTFADPLETSGNNTPKHVKQQSVQLTNVLILPSTGVNTATIASGSKPRSNTKKDKTLPAKSVPKKKVEDHPRNNKSKLSKKNRVDSYTSVRSIVCDTRSLCKTCNECINSDSHDKCVDKSLKFSKPTPVRKIWRVKQVKQTWQPTGKLFTSVGHHWKPTGRTFLCPLTRPTALTSDVVLADPQAHHAPVDYNIVCSNQLDPNIDWGSNNYADNMANENVPPSFIATTKTTSTLPPPSSPSPQQVHRDIW
ncbi:hypothetical protein Tco_0424946 [Tanacetum coccineum]